MKCLSQKNWENEKKQEKELQKWEKENKGT
jgi:hypothetical protein